MEIGSDCRHSEKRTQQKARNVIAASGAGTCRRLAVQTMKSDAAPHVAPRQTM